MKRNFWITGAVIAIFALSLNAIAQPGGGQGQRGQGPAGGVQQPFAMGAGQMGAMGAVQTPQALLRNAEVVRMLQLTESQTSALAEVLPAMRAPGAAGQGGGPGAGGQGFAPGGAGGAAQMMPAAIAQRNTAMWAGIDEILNETQQARFKQIYFQANNGLNSNSLDVWMLATLDLTDAQKTTINDLTTARAAALRELGPAVGGGGGGGAAAGGAAAAEARTEVNTRFNTQIREVLTPQQRRAAAQLAAGTAELREQLGLPALPAAATQQPGQRGQGQAPGAPGAGGGQRGQGGALPGAGPGAGGGGQPAHAGAGADGAAGAGRRPGAGAGHR